jgi:CheY-like chemotaxis protein
LTVRIDLPIRETSAPLAAPPCDGPEVEPSDLRGRRVLLIEDDGDTRDFLRLSLEGAGAVVRFAGSGAEALALLTRGPVDVVLSDLTLPQGDRYGVIRAMRALGMTRVPVVALSALSDPAERARTEAAGFREHLAKPIDPEQLVHCVTRVVREADAA